MHCIAVSLHKEIHCVLNLGSPELEGRAEMLVNVGTGGIVYFSALLNVTAWRVCIKKTDITRLF